MQIDHAHALLTSKEHREADQRAIAAGISRLQLIENAGEAAARAIIEAYAPRTTLVLAGPGHNGADGWATALALEARGWPVRVWSLDPQTAETSELASRAGHLRIDQAEPQNDEMVVDAVFGSGISRPIEGPAKAVLERCASHGGVCVALDLPSGVNADTGAVDPVSLCAALTVTFLSPKPGHFIEPARQRRGRLVVADIGHAAPAPFASGPVAALNAPRVWGAHFPRHAAGAHKYQRGAVAVFTGGPGSTGAARLAARAALASGAGLVTLFCPPSALLVAATHETAVMTKSWNAKGDEDAALNKCRALVLGPGFGLDKEAQKRMEAVLAATDCPRVLDADALTLLAAGGAEVAEFGGPAILTPHRGEFVRLFPDLAGHTKIEAARAAASRTGAVLVLKGADTVVASPQGDVLVEARDAPQLGTAGSGDTLAGIIGGFLAQGASPFMAAAIGVWLHGDVGRHLRFGASADDMARWIPEARSRVIDTLRRHDLMKRLANAGN